MHFWRRICRLGADFALRYGCSMCAHRPMVQTLICLSLTLILAVTSVHLAAMRSSGGLGAAWLEICDAGGVTLLAVDGNGAPVPSHPPCPDCVIAAAVIVPAIPEVRPPLTAALNLTTAAPSLTKPPILALEASARGPPRLA